MGEVLRNTIHQIPISVPPIYWRPMLLFKYLFYNIFSEIRRNISTAYLQGVYQARHGVKNSDSRLFRCKPADGALRGA